MKVYFASDHAGFELKKELMPRVAALGHEVEDCGAFELEASDDYPQIIACAARALVSDVAQGLDSRAIVIGASGQGEMMAMNRFPQVRAALYYAAAGSQTDADGTVLDMLTSTRTHNNANALSLAARFLSAEEAFTAVKSWLEAGFSGAPRHVRRIAQLDALPDSTGTFG